MPAPEVDGGEDEEKDEFEDEDELEDEDDLEEREASGPCCIALLLYRMKLSGRESVGEAGCGEGEAAGGCVGGGRPLFEDAFVLSAGILKSKGGGKEAGFTYEVVGVFRGI